MTKLPDIYTAIISHDRALDLDCMERMAMVMGALGFLTIVEYSISQFPVISAFASMPAMIYCAMQWSKMCNKRKPFKNCWEYYNER